MPPKGTKRAATPSSVEKAAKKIALKKSAVVAAQISKFEGLPESCRTMLASIADSILTTYATDRHPFQVKAMEMIAQSLAMVQADLESCLSKAKEKVNNSSVDHEAHRAALAAAEAKLVASQEALVKAEETLQASIASEKAAKVDVNSVQAELKAKEDELAGEVAKKKELENAREAYEELKASKQAGKDMKTSLKSVTKVLSQFELEDSVINALSEVLVKDASSRGTFDGIVLQQVDAKFPEWIASVDSSIKACETRQEELPKSIAAAEERHAALVTEFSTSKEAVQTATTAVSEDKSAVKEATAALKMFEKGMPAAEGDLEKAKGTLSSFMEGPLKAFDDLKTFAAPQPEPDGIPEETAPAPEETKPSDLN
jgi:chromosome segregation ATPase